MDADLRNAYRFHKEHGGGIVGRQAEGALAMARAELVLSAAVDLGVASVEWVDDEEPYDPGDVCTEDEARERFASNEWTGPYGCAVTVFGADGDETAQASLWGIVVGPRGTADPYCRVVAAELAYEVLDDLRQAIGDARDRRLEELRGELRAERISWGELAELQDLAGHIAPGDVELLEAAGVPEHPENA